MEPTKIKFETCSCCRNNIKEPYFSTHLKLQCASLIIIVEIKLLLLNSCVTIKIKKKSIINNNLFMKIIE